MGKFGSEKILGLIVIGNPPLDEELGNYILDLQFFSEMLDSFLCRDGFYGPTHNVVQIGSYWVKLGVWIAAASNRLIIE